MDQANSNYAKLGKSRRPENGHTGLPSLVPPRDTYNAAYVSFVFGGAGFLFPYNSFIMAMDYFKIRYPGSPVVFDMSLVYIVVAFITVLGNNLLVETFSMNSRIHFGYIVSFFTLVFVLTCEVWWEAFGDAVSYTVNLLAVAVVAVGCTVQQSSFYGYTSMLPSRYTQALMVGESASGVFISLARVATRYIVPGIRGSTIYFFSVSASAIICCFFNYHIIRRSDLIQFYIALCERTKTRITLEPTEDAGLIETNDAHYGVLKIQNSPPPCTTLSFANPVYEPSAPAPTYKVEDVVVRGRSSVSTRGSLSGFRRGVQARWEITKAIYPYMICICLTYFATLCLYPGVISEIQSCRLGPWMPFVMMAIFNGADLFGKMLAASSWYWTGTRLVKCSVARLVMIPLMLMCALPRGGPIFSAEMFAFFFSLILGLSNGVLGSVPMIQAPSKVDDRYRELTGNLMTLLYNFGLTAGSLTAYLLESLLNPSEEYKCGMNQDQSKMQNISSTMATSTAPIMTTVISTIVTTISELKTNTTV